MEFRALPPWMKLGAWAVMISGGLALLQLIAWLIRWDKNMLDDGVPLIVAVVSLMVVMSLDRRPISDYGLFVGPTWKTLWLRGIATGVASYSAYLLLAIGSGALVVQTKEVSAGRCASAFFTGMTGFPLAITQQVIFSGYLLSILRDRYHRLIAVGVSAALFAVMNRVENLPSLAEPLTQQLMLGLFLIAAMLGMLRLLTGSVLIPAGLLAGWIFVRRFTGELRLLVPDPQSPLLNWIAPQGDTRQAPVMAALVAIGAIGTWLALRRWGEGKVPLSEEALNADFKRVFPLSNIHMLAPLDVWLRRLWKARFCIGLDYLPRMIAITVLSTLNTILTLPERLISPWLLLDRRIRPPVFIVGVHRSGTTHLHNLMSLDPQFCTVPTHHVMNPAGALLTGWLLVPVMAIFLPWRRPMDRVRFHVFSPQEEEFAIAAACGLSPHWGMTFPQQWAEYDRYIYPDRLPPAERQTWCAAYLHILRQLTFWNSKTPLLKNPYNTGRVATLAEMFPGAKFVHIHRHPHDVYRSNVLLAEEGHVCGQLQDQSEQDSYQSRFLENYREMETVCRRDSERLHAEQWTTVPYERLDQDPIGVLKQVYRELELDWTNQFEQNLERYLAGLSDYKKNRHQPLPDQQRAQIDAAMGPFMARWGYLDSPQQKAA